MQPATKWRMRYVPKLVQRCSRVNNVPSVTGDDWNRAYDGTIGTAEKASAMSRRTFELICRLSPSNDWDPERSGRTTGTTNNWMPASSIAPPAPTCLKLLKEPCIWNHGSAVLTGSSLYQDFNDYRCEEESRTLARRCRAGRRYRHRLRFRYRCPQEGRGRVHRLRSAGVWRSARAGRRPGESHRPALSALETRQKANFANHWRA
jgi:hypothetical protein